MLHAEWYFKDDGNGQRVGPVDQAEIERLIADNKFDRATLVWNPAQADWARASTTDLVSLFGNAPPPMPAGEISRWAIYAVALLPVWGTVIQAVTSVALSAKLNLTPDQMYGHWAWIAAFIAGNAILGETDKRNLEKGGLTIRGAAFLSALLIPVYIFMSCKTVRRHTKGGYGWLAYLPFWLWIASFIGGIFVGGAILEAN